MSAFQNVAIPYGSYWSTPFSKWQGSLSQLHAMRFAAHVATKEMARRQIDPAVFDHAVCGFTTPQRSSFVGTPWFMSMIGAGHVGGTLVSQACASSARALASAALELEQGFASVSLCVAGDRTSNAPTLLYPEPASAGGAASAEHWILDNLKTDPVGGPAMVGTAENCARDWKVPMTEQHDVVLRRWEQYTQALADGHAFQRRYMTLPFEVPDPSFRKTVTQLEGDEGVRASTAEGLAALRPVLDGGTVTFGAQTHPADGNAAIILCSPARARELSSQPNVEIALRSYGQARVKHTYMPYAPVPAALQALDRAGLRITDIDAVKTHNPFAVNDIVFSRETGYDVNKMNNYGCSLIWGHPNGPTGMRSIIELIEELVLRGGGRGLFTGCAAGDSAMAIVIEVRDRRA